MLHLHYQIPDQQAVPHPAGTNTWRQFQLKLRPEEVICQPTCFYGGFRHDPNVRAHR
jgi:hypothetical protein